MSRTINLGAVTAYADAVEAGYTGTREEFAQDLANAATYAATSAQAKIDAEAAAGTATTKAGEAATSAGSAADDADDAHSDALAALSYKETAETAAGTATTKAGEAANSASTANTKAGEAAASATAASGSAGAASTSAGQASTSATTSTTQALKSEGYAVGKQNGTDVAEGSDYYHNNAKYYSEQAAAQLPLVTAEGTRQIGLVDAKGDEVLASIPADYTTLSNDVDDLKSEISQLNNDLVKTNYTWASDFNIGTQLYDLNNGSLVPSTYKQGYRVATLYTSPVYLHKGAHLHIPSNRAFRYTVSTDGVTYVLNTGDWIYGEADYLLPYDGYYAFSFTSVVNGQIDTIQVGSPTEFVKEIEFTYAENKIVDDLSDAVIKYTSWANGSVRGTIAISDSGWSIDNFRPTSRFTTDIDNPFYLYCGDEIICPTGYRMFVSWRDGNGTYKKYNDWIVEGSFKVPENGYFALCISTKTDVAFSETFDAIVKKFTITTAKTVAERIYVIEKNAETETILYDGLLGGKLPFNESDFENGSMTNGANDNYQKQARARSKVIQTNNYDMTILADTNWHMFISYYDANGNYISGNGWLAGEYTIPKNTYYRLLFCLNNTDSTARSVSEILSHFKIETYSDKEKEVVPEYYFQNDYLPDKSALIRDNSVRNGITFAFITDIHVEINAGRSPMLLNYLLNHNNSIQGVLFGGDVPMDQATTAEVKAQGDKWTNWVSKIGKDKVYQCAGNHDYCGIHNSVWTGLSQNYIYNYVMGGQLLRIHAPALKKYYYFDVEPLKTRFVVLDNYDRAENEPTYANKVGVSYDQLHWLCNGALANIDGYHVIVVSHQNSDPNLSYYDSNLAVVRSLLVAFANKSTFSYDGLEKDFTNDTNTLVMHLAGHVHTDESNFSDGVLSVNTTCDARYTGVSVDPNRVVGTISEQAFDVFSIDYDARTVKTVRIGYGSDRSLTY